LSLCKRGKFVYSISQIVIHSRQNNEITFVKINSKVPIFGLDLETNLFGNKVKMRGSGQMYISESASPTFYK